LQGVSSASAEMDQYNKRAMQQEKHDEKSDASQPLQVNRGNIKNEHDFVKDVIAAIPGLFYLLDANRQFVMCNDYLRDSVRFKSEQEMSATSALQHIHPDDRLLVKEKIGNIISTGVEDWLEVRAFRQGSPEFLWYLLRGKRVIIDQKPFVIGIGTDITDRKKSENELQKLNRTLLMSGKCNESMLQSEQHYRNLFQNHQTVMLIIDPENGQIVDANPAAATFYGWPIETLCRMHIQEINTLSPEQIKLNMAQSRTGKKNHFSFHHRRADGSIRDVEVFSNKVEIAGKDFLYSIIHEVTERKHFEIVTAFHLSLILMAATHSIEELLQTTVDEAERLTESSIGFLHFVAEDQMTVSQQVWSTNTIKNKCTAEGEAQHYALNKAGIWADAAREKKAVIHNDYSAIKHRKGMPEGHTEVRRELVVPVVRDEKVVAILGVGNKHSEYDADDVKWVGLIADMTWDIVAKKIAKDEQKILQAQKFFIENLAMHDALTGLPNRRLLSDRMSQALGQCQRNSTMAALMIFDLDKFKIVNDTLGHGIGDRLLQQVATRTLGALLRSGDSIARLGGDEFVVLLPHIASISNAVATAEKIRRTIKETFEVEGRLINISCSLGIAVFPEHGQDELTLMKHADDAMYRSKSYGGNCITVYEGELS
jgi:diguanylate cyclase (GGDEF)-like protein/PAS domain S-box-containing protein